MKFEKSTPPDLPCAKSLEPKHQSLRIALILSLASARIAVPVASFADRRRVATLPKQSSATQMSQETRSKNV
jgi:hypothetical protein